jgi:hypothetical protein
MNIKTITHNKIVYDKTLGETFNFFAKDIHSKTCPFHFKLSMLPSHTNGLHHELLLLKNMLIELRVGNYATIDGLVNGANGTFKDYIENHLELLIWIYFQNS